MGKCARCGKKNLYLEAGICMPWQLQQGFNQRLSSFWVPPQY